MNNAEHIAGVLALTDAKTIAELSECTGWSERKVLAVLKSNGDLCAKFIRRIAPSDIKIILALDDASSDVAKLLNYRPKTTDFIR